MTIEDLSDMVEITNTYGTASEWWDANEPALGSVVLTEGSTGTAWQRLFKDGLWHSARGGRPKTWEQMLRMRNMTLVHDAPARSNNRSE